MASTNHTTNYSLSQFVGSDKPAWLGDYNQDMDKIDTQMKVNADAVSTLGTTVSGHTTAISGLTSDMATAQNDISGLGTRMTAVETKNTEQDTAITNAQNKADTADGKADTNAQNIASQGLDITSLQSDSASHATAIAQNTSAITTLDTKLNNFEQEFNLTNITRQTSGVVTQSAYTNLNLAQSSDSSLFKFYGRYTIDNSTGSTITFAKTAVTGLSGYYGIKTSLQLTTAPDETYYVQDSALFIPKYPSGSGTNFEVETKGFAVDTSGFIWVDVSTNNSYSISAYCHNTCYFAPCVYFNKSFGDTPQA